MKYALIGVMVLFAVWFAVLIFGATLRVMTIAAVAGAAARRLSEGHDPVAEEEHT